MQSFFKHVDDEDILPFHPNSLSYRTLSKFAYQSIYFLPFDNEKKSVIHEAKIPNIYSIQIFAKSGVKSPWTFGLSQNGLHLSYRAKDEIEGDDQLYFNIRTPPYSHLLLNSKLMNNNFGKLYFAVAMKRHIPMESITQYVYKHKGQDRASVELYTTMERVPTFLFMTLAELNKNFRIGFDLGGKESIGNAGFSVAFFKNIGRNSWTQWTLRQTYMGQTDLCILNNMNRNVQTSGNFTYNSTDNTSKYGMSLIFNLPSYPAPSKIRGSSLGLRWTSDKGWGLRWNADMGEYGCAGFSLGGGQTFSDADMKIGVHYTIHI